MKRDEAASLRALSKGATLEDALSLLDPLTPEQLARLDERGDPIEWGVDEILRQISVETDLN